MKMAVLKTEEIASLDPEVQMNIFTNLLRSEECFIPYKELQFLPYDGQS